MEKNKSGLKKTNGNGTNTLPREVRQYEQAAKKFRDAFDVVSSLQNTPAVKEYLAAAKEAEKQPMKKKPDIVGACDLLDRAKYKLGFFSTPFYGGSETMEILDPAGAVLILEEITDEITKAREKLTAKV